MLGAVIVAAGAFLWWAQPQALLPEATAALVSTPEATFIQDSDGRLTYRPASGEPTIGLVLYPGGKVPPAAYAPQAQAIAAHGYLVAIVPVPFNLAVFDIDAAEASSQTTPRSSWAVGGHSLGGSMAAQFLASHQGAIDGLVLWASYSAADISATGVTVASTYGTLDRRGLVHEPGERRQARAERDVHAHRGRQPRADGLVHRPAERPPATISREAQQQAVVAATLDLLQALP